MIRAPLILPFVDFPAVDVVLPSEDMVQEEFSGTESLSKYKKLKYGNPLKVPTKE
jgi:hypothetical protein